MAAMVRRNVPISTSSKEAAAVGSVAVWFVLAAEAASAVASVRRTVSRAVAFDAAWSSLETTPTSR